MNKYFRKCGAFLLAVLVAVTVVGQGQQAQAASNAPQLAYTLKGLPKSSAVQNFSITSNAIYVVQKENANGDLMLVKYNKSNSKKVGTMKLKGFGHGESLEVAKNSKGIEYVYIAAQKYKDKNGNIWSTQLSRFKFVSGQTLYSNNVPRLRDMNYANRSNVSIGTVKRFNFAISSDNKNFVLRIQNTNNSIQFSKYSHSYIDSLLDIAEKNKTSISMRNRQKNCSIGFYQKSKTSVNSPNGSFQGMEVSSDGNIFTSGGSTSTAATITKMNSKGGYIKRVNISQWKGYEIEGLHLNGKLYATYKTGTNVAKIYIINF